MLSAQILDSEMYLKNFEFEKSLEETIRRLF